MGKILSTFFRALSLILGGAVFFAFLGFGAFAYINSAPASKAIPSSAIPGISIDTDGTYILVVQNGESSNAVGKRLEAAGIIRSTVLWNILGRLHREYIKIGTYRIAFGSTQLEIRDMLVSGKQILFKVTIPGGSTLGRAAKLLEEARICKAEDFLVLSTDKNLLNRYGIPGTSFEGYLFPDTYLFPMEYPPELVISAMVDNFYKRLGQLIPGADAISEEELHKKIVIASIVEREYRVPEEAPVMAGVFYNRLSIGMALQSCATVEYLITQRLGRPHPKVLYNRDIAIIDPYNTYINPGLPPGPISSPGTIALDAAFNPIGSDYLYFRLVDPAEGRHQFSRTLDDHIRAAPLYTKETLADR